MGLLYSLALGNRVIIRSISVVLGLQILIDTPFLGRICGSIRGNDNPLGVFVIHIPSGGKVGYMVLGLRTL